MIISCNSMVDRRDHVQYLTVAEAVPIASKAEEACEV